jgi:uncharacterized MnhB-related membrane protein
VSALVFFILLLVAIAGGGVVFTRSPRRQVIALSMNGLALSVLFMVLQAPDVAFSEIAIGAAALPLMFFVVLASTRMDRQPQEDTESADDSTKPERTP